MPAQAAFATFTNLAAHATGLLAVSVVAATVLGGLWQGLGLFATRLLGRGLLGSGLLRAPRAGQMSAHKQTLQVWLGSRLVLALELELAADLLRSAVSPSWNAFAMLAAVAALRVLLSFALQREMPLPQRVPPAPNAGAGADA